MVPTVMLRGEVLAAEINLGIWMLFRAETG